MKGPFGPLLASCVLSAFLVSPSTAALPDRLRWGLGVEALWESYRERTATIQSTADPRSTRLRSWMEGRLLGRPARLELMLPLTESASQEAWYSGPATIQLNQLDAKRRDFRLQVDAFPGAPALWMGLLYEDLRQRRWDFNVATSFDVAEEMVRSWWFELGWRLPFGPSKADGSWSPSRSRIGLSFAMPLKVETTNTALPGFVVDDVDGLRLRLSAELLRRADRKLRLSWLYLRWNGSDWQSYQGGFARWPRNETRSLSLEASLRF